MRKFWRSAPSAAVLVMGVVAGLLVATVPFAGKASAATLEVTTASLPGGLVSDPTLYQVQLSATGGTAPYTWSVVSGSLPDGYTLTPAGMLWGITTQQGTFTFTVRVTDSGSPAETATRRLTVTIYGEPVPATSRVPAATVGTFYRQQLRSTGGLPPLSWFVVDGSFPPGLTLSTDGLLYGTPTAAGTFTFTVIVDDDVFQNTLGGTTELTLTVNPAAPPPVTISTKSLPGGVAGTAYSQALSASGGTAPYTWSVVKGSLPAGLKLSRGGSVSGTPRTSGTSRFTVQATDSETPAHHATKQLSITVEPDRADIAVSVTGPASAKAGSSVTDTITVTNNGPVPASKLSVSLDTVGLTSVTPSTGGGTRYVTILGITLANSAWSVASLAPGHRLTFTVRGTVQAKRVKAASAVGLARSTTPDPDPFNNVGGVTTRVTG